MVNFFGKFQILILKWIKISENISKNMKKYVCEKQSIPITKCYGFRKLKYFMHEKISKKYFFFFTMDKMSDIMVNIIKKTLVKYISNLEPKEMSKFRNQT